ncbi:MAG: protein-glutamate O-methyltransferase CheR [Gammaproteobacteria bacterium]
MDDLQFKAFSSLTHKLTGVSIAPARRPMLIARVSSRMRACKIADIDLYLDRVLEDEQERVMFIDKVTTHETYFFRTARVWEYIEERFLPAWTKKNGGRTCKVWSAAASSGQEAYSTAMLMDDYAKKTSGFRFSVHGSDVSAEVVRKCQLGVYQGRSIDRLRQSRPDFLERYFAPEGEGFRVHDDLKRCVSFSTHNLFDDLRLSKKYDLILCRNVLIYFNREDQLRVLKNLKSAMGQSSVLIIGESERLVSDNDMFDDIEPLVYGPSVSSINHQPENRLVC